MSFWNSWLPRLLSAISTPPADGGQSPADALSGSLAGAAASAGNPRALEAYGVQQQAKQSAQDSQLRSMLAKNQLATSQASQAREQSLVNAQVGHLNAETSNLQNPPLKPKEESWDIVPNITGPNGEPVQQEKNSGQVRLVSGIPGMKPAAPKQPTEQPLGADRVSQLNSALQSRWNVLHPDAPLPSAYSLQGFATEGDYARLAAALSGEEAAYGQKNQRDILNQNAAQNRQDRLDAASEKANKPTADETRRADLAANMSENLDALEGIVNRRPDLFGPLAGRATQLKQMIGTSDPDIASLNAIKEYFGMASVGAHSMRNAQHVAAAADAVANFHNEPGAIKAAIQQARNSLETFLSDANRGSQPATGGSAKQRPPLASFEH